MSTVDVINAAAAFVAALILTWVGVRVLSRVVAVLPLDARRHAAARRWLPAIQLLFGIAAFSAVAVLALGPRAAAIVAAAATAIIIAAAWFAIRDVIAGIVLRADHGFEEDQVVRIGDISGTIHEIGTRSLEIESRDGRRVRVPYGRIGRSAVAVADPNEGSGALRFTIELPAHGATQDDLAAIRSAALHAFFASARREPRVRLLGQSAQGRSYEVTVYADDPAYLPSIEQAVMSRLTDDEPRAVSEMP